MRLRRWIFIALFCAALSGQVSAGDAPVPEPAEAKPVTVTEKALAPAPSWLRELLTDPLFITILFLMGSTLVGAFLKGRARDACLKSLHGGPVHVELTDGRVIYGTLRLGNSGLEILFERPHTDEEDRIVKHSYLMYESEYAKIQAVVRYPSELNEAQRRERQKEIRRSHNPGFFRRSFRRIHNIVKTIKDAINEAFGLMLGRVKGAKGAEVVKSQEKYIRKAQSEMATAVTASSFDVLLEKLIGKRVIVEAQRDGAKQELDGVFREYTAKYMELMDVMQRKPFEVAATKGDTIEAEGGGSAAASLQIEWAGDEMTVTNKGKHTVCLEAIAIGEDVRPLDPPVEIKLKGAHTETIDADDCTLRCTELRTADLVLPRSLAIVRHRARAESKP